MNVRSRADMDARKWRQNTARNVTWGTPRAYCSAMPPTSAAVPQRKTRARKAPAKVAAPVVELGINDLHPVLKQEVLSLAGGNESRVSVLSRTEAIIRNH